MQQIHDRAKELASTGSVMMIELVQVAEDYLLEHNQDPNMSAWEQMKAREDLEQKEKRKAQEEVARIMNAETSNNYEHRLSPTPSKGRSWLEGEGPTFASSDIEREFLRQREALEAARSRRNLENDALTLRKQPSSATQDETTDIDDEDEIDFDDGYNAMGPPGLSRYRNDFIELGLLGRGGGGEVVKVRNRLDRRIYAIKKIILETEQGNRAEFAALQNRKLRREVTTISRMTHKNIVRYYQAWVEGGREETIKEAVALEEGDESSKQENVDLATSDDGSSVGFWDTSPVEQSQQRDRVKKDSSDEDAESDRYGQYSASDDVGIDLNNVTESSQDHRHLHSGSLMDLLEHENGQGFNSPLLTGLGFQDEMYRGLFSNNPTALSSSDSVSDEVSNPWDESSVKMDALKGRAILYIQMEYCATTLRRLIDEGAVSKMEENEVWRMIRQILEALVYIHSRNIIHRDLKPGKYFESLSFILFNEWRC